MLQVCLREPLAYIRGRSESLFMVIIQDWVMNLSHLLRFFFFSLSKPCGQTGALETVKNVSKYKNSLLELSPLLSPSHSLFTLSLWSLLSGQCVFLEHNRLLIYITNINSDFIQASKSACLCSKARSSLVCRSGWSWRGMKGCQTQSI